LTNPFESGHIKNYLLLYASVIVIMILFFIASTLFNDVEVFDKKVFDTNASEIILDKEDVNETIPAQRFRLLDKAY
jgi:hypothetical protein